MDWEVGVGGAEEGLREAMSTRFPEAWRMRETRDEVWPVPPVRRMDIVLGMGEVDYGNADEPTSFLSKRQTLDDTPAEARYPGS